MKNKEYFNVLFEQLNKDAHLHDCEMSKAEYLNLEYAFNVVSPETHVDLAFVAACGTSIEYTGDLADEYDRRRQGREAKIVDHPFFEINEFVVPETQRVLIFKEQT